MDVAVFEAGLKAEGYQVITSVAQPAGYELGDHVHPFDACALILDGHFTITVAGVDRHYGPGDVFRLPAGTPHSERAGSEGVSYRAGRRTREA